MSDLHVIVGWSIPIAFGVLVLWTVFAFLSSRPPGEWFWHILAAAQVVIGIQFVIGGVMYLSGRRAAPNGPEFLHYVYGAFFPMIVLLVAHHYARRFREVPWVVFGIAAFVCCFSTIRALQTGLGVD